MKESTKTALIGGVSGAIISGIVAAAIFIIPAIFGAGSIAKAVDDNDSAIKTEIRPELRGLTDQVGKLANQIGTLQGNIEIIKELIERQQISSLAARALPAIPSVAGKAKAIGTLDSFDPATRKATIRIPTGETRTYSLAHNTSVYVCPPSKAGCAKSSELSKLKAGDAVAFRYAPSDSQIDRIYTAPSSAARAYLPPAPR